jgi:hypothetical protein
MNKVYLFIKYAEITHGEYLYDPIPVIVLGDRLGGAGSSSAKWARYKVQLRNYGFLGYVG